MVARASLPALLRRMPKRMHPEVTKRPKTANLNVD